MSPLKRDKEDDAWECRLKALFKKLPGPDMDKSLRPAMRENARLQKNRNKERIYGKSVKDYENVFNIYEPVDPMLSKASLSGTPYSQQKTLEGDSSLDSKSKTEDVLCLAALPEYPIPYLPKQDVNLFHNIPLKRELLATNAARMRQSALVKKKPIVGNRTEDEFNKTIALIKHKKLMQKDFRIPTQPPPKVKPPPPPPPPKKLSSVEKLLAIYKESIKFTASDEKLLPKKPLVINRNDYGEKLKFIDAKEKLRLKTEKVKQRQYNEVCMDELLGLKEKGTVLPSPVVKKKKLQYLTFEHTTGRRALDEKDKIKIEGIVNALRRNREEICEKGEVEAAISFPEPLKEVAEESSTSTEVTPPIMYPHRLPSIPEVSEGHFETIKPPVSKFPGLYYARRIDRIDSASGQDLWEKIGLGIKYGDPGFPEVSPQQMSDLVKKISTDSFVEDLTTTYNAPVGKIPYSPLINKEWNQLEKIVKEGTLSYKYVLNEVCRPVKSDNQPTKDYYDFKPLKSTVHVSNLWTRQLATETFSKNVKRFKTAETRAVQWLGPGRYDVRDLNSALNSNYQRFSSLPRFKAKQADNVPAPGTYEVKDFGKPTTFVPSFEWSRPRPKLSCDYKLAPNIYEIENIGSISERTKHPKILKGPPFQVFSGPRDETSYTGYLKVDKNKGKADSPLKLKSFVDDLLAVPYRGKWRKPRKIVKVVKAALEEDNVYKRTALLPDDSYRTVTRKLKEKKEYEEMIRRKLVPPKEQILYAFNKSTPARPEGRNFLEMALAPGPGHYNPKYPKCMAPPPKIKRTKKPRNQ